MLSGPQVNYGSLQTQVEREQHAIINRRTERSPTRVGITQSNSPNLNSQHTEYAELNQKQDKMVTIIYRIYTNIF